MWGLSRYREESGSYWWWKRKAERFKAEKRHLFYICKAPSGGSMENGPKRHKSEPGDVSAASGGRQWWPGLGRLPVVMKKSG